MKQLLLLMLLGALSTVGYAQNEQFKTGQLDLQVGAGFIPTLSNESVGLTSTFKAPPLSLGGEYGISDRISLGGYIGTARSKVYLEQIMRQRTHIADYQYSLFGARGSYHFDLLPALDTYAGALIGYHHIAVSYIDDTSEKLGDSTYGGFVGGRARLGKTAGVFLELGYGIAFINFGLNLKW